VCVCERERVVAATAPPAVAAPPPGAAVVVVALRVCVCVYVGYIERDRGRMRVCV